MPSKGSAILMQSLQALQKRTHSVTLYCQKHVNPKQTVPNDQYVSTRCALHKRMNQY